MFGQPGIVFLSANNSVVVAHKGSSASLSCRLTKGPSFGMVSEKPFYICGLGGNQYCPPQEGLLDFLYLLLKTKLQNIDFQVFFYLFAQGLHAANLFHLCSDDLVSSAFALVCPSSAHHWRLGLYWRSKDPRCQKTSWQCKMSFSSWICFRSEILGLAAWDPRCFVVWQRTLSLPGHLPPTHGSHHYPCCSRSALLLNQ